MKNSDYEPFGPFSHQTAVTASRARPLFPTGQVTRQDRKADEATPVDVAPRSDLRQYDQAKVHGAKAALTFITDETRACEPTVTIECAARAEGSERAYAWNDKLRFQLSGNELQLLTCLLLGAAQELSFRNHGEKWCGIARQSSGQFAGTVRMTMGQGEAAQFVPRTVAIDFNAIGPVTALCLRQCAQLLRVPIETVPNILRIVARAYAEQRESRSSASGRPSTEDGAGNTATAIDRRRAAQNSF
jgi:hypothetical protein